MTIRDTVRRAEAPFLSDKACCGGGFRGFRPGEAKTPAG
jgi:hypothetical protein